MINISTSLTIFLLITLSTTTFGQETIHKKINFIIMIDGDIDISPFKPYIYTGDIKIEVKYIPGELSIKDSDWEALEKYDNFFLNFYHYDYSRSGKENNYHYDIQLNTSWLEGSYIILNIYNLNKKENRRKYFSNSEKPYVVEINLPGYSISPIQRKL